MSVHVPSDPASQEGSEASAASTAELVKQLLALLHGGQAHATLAAAVKDFPADLRGTVPEPLPYSAWQILEHIRIAQRDILDFCAPPEGGYQPMEWPKAYWPESAAPPTAEAWNLSLAAIEADEKSFAALLSEPHPHLYLDLCTPFPWGDGQNLLRETLLLADHNSYHTGELIVLRRILGIWKK